MRIDYEINTIECKLTLGRNLLWGGKCCSGENLLWGSKYALGRICSGEVNMLWGESALGK
ncbi:MAG TPA: hypothetical protein PLR86_01560 [Planctomycetota bacterium]|nr:hypothetical protein [Planctomycetota bacterium]